MAETCGDKDLLRTATGQTVDKPCRGAVMGMQVYCNAGDWEDWRDRIEQLMSMMITTWNALYEAEDKLKVREHTAEGSQLRARWDRIVARIDHIEKRTWHDYFGSKGIAELVSIAQDEACLIDTMRLYIQQTGEEPPPLPYVEPPSTPDLDDMFKDTQEAITSQIPKITTGLLVIGGLAAVSYIFKKEIVQAVANVSRKRGAK